MKKRSKNWKMFLFRRMKDRNILVRQTREKTVAFFYITSKGSANVRKPGDYVAKMITMADGTYVPRVQRKKEENALSTMNMEMEAFYAKAKDAG